MNVFTLGIGRVIASGYAMKKCIPFLQTAYIAPLNWIIVNGIQHKYVTAIDFELRDRWFDNSISVMDALMNEIDENQDIIRMNDTRSDDEITDDLWNDSNPENCDGCANQESIAAPRETTKCREHQEKREPLIEWMAKNIERPMDFSIFDSCENCHEFPPTQAIVGDSAIPFFLCDYCHGQFANLLSADARKRLVHI